MRQRELLGHGIFQHWHFVPKCYAQHATSYALQSVKYKQINGACSFYYPTQQTNSVKAQVMMCSSDNWYSQIYTSNPYHSFIQICSILVHVKHFKVLNINNNFSCRKGGITLPRSCWQHWHNDVPVSVFSCQQMCRWLDTEPFQRYLCEALHGIIILWCRTEQMQ